MNLKKRKMVMLIALIATKHFLAWKLRNNITKSSICKNIPSSAKYVTKTLDKKDTLFHTCEFAMDQSARYMKNHTSEMHGTAQNIYKNKFKSDQWKRCEVKMWTQMLTVYILFLCYWLTIDFTFQNRYVKFWFCINISVIKKKKKKYMFWSSKSNKIWYIATNN